MLTLSGIHGVIRRRILINFRVDPAVMQRQLPARFRPKLQAGYAVAGICLIRLEQLRPRGLPALLGVSSENAAHRVAVLWEDAQGITREGVFIPRRDTNSLLNLALGGRLFPGAHHKAAFQIDESGAGIHLTMQAQDASVALEVAGCAADALPPASIFPSLAVASAFFAAGAVGYSLTRDPTRLDGLRLHTDAWQVTPLAIQQVYSSYFADEARFPPGSVALDHALLMRNVVHEWHTVPDLRLPAAARGPTATRPTVGAGRGTIDDG